MKFSVDMQTYANATIEVELDDERLAEIAVDLEKNVEDLTIDDLRDYVGDEAYMQGVPGICAQCSGWGHKHSLSLDDDWDIVGDDPNAKPEHRSIRIVKD